MRTAQRAAFRPGTFKNLKLQLNTYLLFCEQFHLTPFPTDHYVVCKYACFLAEDFKNSNSVRNYISGIKTWSIILQYETKEFYSTALKLTLNGLDKLNINVPNVKLPILPSHLLAIFRNIDLSIALDCVLWSLILIAFFAMLRKSQFANDSVKSFNPLEQLTRRDIQFTEEGLILHIQWSKTNQKHQRIHEIPLKRTSDFVLCPVTAYARMVTLVPASPNDPAFCLSDRTGKIRAFSKSEIDNIFRNLIIHSNMDPANYTFHSLRRGGATCAAAAGCSDSEICTIGNWVSSCYRGYIRMTPQQMYKVSSQMAQFCITKYQC